LLVIDQYTERFEKVDMNLVKTPDCEPEMIDMLRGLDLVDFRQTYTSLATLLAQFRRSTHGQVTFTTPPGQTTIPANPYRSDGSTSSTESKPELNAQSVAEKFLGDARFTINKWMTRFEWAKSHTKLFLSEQ
jgi:hypothetical protein